MKKRVSTKIISGILAFVMVVLILPIGNITASAEEAISLSENPSKMLGFGFNAISDADGSITTGDLINRNWIDIDSDKTKVYIFGDRDGSGVLEQYGKASYAKSSLEMMKSFGIDYTNTANANFSMNKIKAGVETKFGSSFDMSNTKTTSELYYYYTYKAICNRYALYSDYSNYLSEDFLAAVKNINLDSPSSIHAFFSKYGTHMLTSFETGGEVQLTGWAYSTSNDTEILAELENTVSANVGIGDIASASTSSSMVLKFKSSTTNTEITSNVNYSAVGGTNLYVDVADPESMTIDKDKLEVWVESLSENPVFIPSSSEWIAVWEVLPQTAEYENIRQALYNYFVENTKSTNEDFLTRFCSFSNRVTINGYTYISSDGYVFQNVPYETDNYVSPGSTISINKDIDDTVFALDSITIEIDDVNSTVGATIDRNGVIKLDAVANNGEKLIVKIKSGDITIRTLNFEIKAEGDGIFAGGYGTKARPYLISNATHIVSLSTNPTIASDPGKYYLLVPENKYGIDMSTVSNFTGISLFAGTFDGNGYRIYGYNIINNTNVVGFFCTNSGTIKNLTMGRMDNTLVDGYSAKVSSSAKESIGHTSRIGGLVGKNDGIIDNCYIENVYVFGKLDDVDDNTTAYCLVGGLVGTNHKILTRCSAIGNNITATMGTVGNSGDDNEAYAGGIAGGNYYTVKNTIANNNYIRAHADGNGTGGAFKRDNYAYPCARAGGVLGYAGGNAVLSSSATYDNDISASYSATDGDSWTKGSNAWGGLIGSQNGNVKGSYTTQTCNVFGSGSSSGGIKVSTIADLNAMFNTNELFTENIDEKLIINPVSSIRVSSSSGTFVVEDYLNLQDCIVYGITEKSGNIFQEYNNGVDNYATVNFNQFRIEGFSSKSSGNVTATITGYGGYTAQYIFEILPETITGIEISHLPYKTSYYEGDSLDTTGLSVKKFYNTGKFEEINDASITVLGFKNNQLGSQTLTVSLEGFSANYNITVYSVKPISISVNSLPDKVAYALGDTFDTTGLSVTVMYNNGTTKTITNGFDLSGFESSSEGTKEIEVAYTFADDELNKNITLYSEFTVNVGTVTDVKVKNFPNKTEYYTSDGKLDITGLSLELTYSNGLTKTVTSGFSTPYGYNLNKSGVQDVMISYNGIVTSFEINVTEVVLDSIEISHLPKTQYYVGETLSTSGLCINRTYNDGTSSEVWSGYTVMVNGYDEGELPTFLSTGTKNVTIYYADGSQRKSIQYEITISSVALEKIEIGQMPYKTKYKENDTFLTTGMVVNAVFNNGDIEQITDFTTSYDFSSVGEKTVTVWYLGESTSLNVFVVKPERIVISKLPDIIEYQIGDTLDLTGIQVTAIYYDSTHVNIDVEQLYANVTDFDQAGDCAITLTYNALEASFNVMVNEFEIPDDAPMIVIDDARIIAGKTATITIALRNNPGIASLKLNVAYDASLLTLTNVEYNSEIGGQSQLPQSYGSPVILNWFNGTADSEGDFTFATLTFDVSEDANIGDVTNISISYDAEDLYDISETNITFYTEGGALEIIDYTPGDMNGDDTVNNKDMTRLFQYLSGWNVDVNEKALDINGDGVVNNKDLTRLFQYMSGWDVEIY